MNFFAIGSVSSYTANLKLQNKWQMKKEGIVDRQIWERQLAARERTLAEMDPNKRSAYGMFESLRESRENSDETLSSIHSKIAVGKELSYGELEYLRVNDPITYQKVLALENEKESYERDLKRCETREEVQRLKTSKLASALSAMSSVENNPNIPKAAKLAVFMAEHGRMRVLDAVLLKFMQSEQYASMPTQAEKAQAEKELAEAERAERLETVTPEESLQPEASGEAENSEAGRPLGPDAEEPAPSADLPAQAEKAKPHGEKGGADKPSFDDRPTRAEAEQSPEAKKVKRSRAAAYRHTPDGEKSGRPLPSFKRTV